MAHLLSFELVSPNCSSYWICVKTDDVAIRWESVLQCLLELHSRSVEHARPKLVANPGSRGRTSPECVFSLCSVAETVSLTAQHMILQFSRRSDKTHGACGALCHWRGTINAHRGRYVGQWWPRTWISSICSATPGGAPSAPDTSTLQEACVWNMAAAPGPSHHSYTRTWSTNRRAEQGHILGIVLSAFVLREARSEHMQEQLSSPFAQRSVCDEWFDDDEQVVVRPARSPTLGSEWWTPPGAPLEPHVTRLKRATP